MSIQIKISAEQIFSLFCVLSQFHGKFGVTKWDS